MPSNAHLYTSYNSTTQAGSVYQRNLSATTATSVLSQNSFDIRPVMFQFRKRTYVVGQFARLLVYTEYGQLVEGGIIAPNSPPTLAAGTGSSGSLGEAIGYLTFAHKQGTKILQESNPSGPSDTFTLQGNGRTWTDIPATAPDDRVTHVRGYVSVDGAIPRLAWERQIGVTTVVENVLTAALGENLPVNPGLDGEADLDVYARGVPPYCQFAEMYHNSAYYAGDPLHPERIYKSKIDEPESVNSVQSIDFSPSGFLVTPDGEAVTGLKRWNDLLLVTCLRAVYAVQGFDSGDLQIVKISNFYGCVSNASLKNVGPEADVYGAGQEGVWRYNGTFHDLMEKSLRDYWMATYRLNPDAYQHDCFGAEDRTTRTYILQTPLPSDAPGGVASFKWVGHWEPVLSGDDPWWVFDMRGRTDSVMGMLLASNGSTFLEPHTGSCDGIIRRENVASDADDDGDTFAKQMTILTKHYFFGEQDGDTAHGRDFTDFDFFVKNEQTALTASAYAGDDTASGALSAQWTTTIPAGAISLPKARVARTSIHFGPITEINGKGLCLKLTASSPLSVGFRGFSIYHKVGQQERPATS